MQGWVDLGMCSVRVKCKHRCSYWHLTVFMPVKLVAITCFCSYIFFTINCLHYHWYLFIAFIVYCIVPSVCFVVIRYEMSRDSRYLLSHYESVSVSSMESAQCRETTFFKMRNVCVCRSMMNVCFHTSVYFRYLIRYETLFDCLWSEYTFTWLVVNSISYEWQLISMNDSLRWYE